MQLRRPAGIWLASAALAALVAFAILAAGDGVEGRRVTSDDVVTALAIGGALFAGWLVFGALAAFLAGRAVRQGRAPAMAAAYASPAITPAGPITDTLDEAPPTDMPRFDPFTDQARRVLAHAQDEALRFDHSYIGTEHILLALVHEDTGVAAQVLTQMRVDSAKVRTAVEFIIGRGNQPVAGGVGLTPRAKRVIELAIDEARRMDHHYIGTEHLLLGLVAEGEGIAAGVLESLGVNLDRVRHEVIRALGQDSPDQSPDA